MKYLLGLLLIVSLPVVASAQYTPTAGRDALELPPLNESAPLYDKLFSDVKVGEAKVDNRGFNEGNEIINAVFAYLHPQSDLRHDPAVLDRLKALLNPRFASYAAEEKNKRNDIASVFQAQYAYALLKHHRPDDVADVTQAWDAGARAVIDFLLEDREVIFTRHEVAGLWLNGDIRLALAVYFAGRATDDAAAAETAATTIDQVMTRAVIGDGATHYVGFQNESPTYHSMSILYLSWWWTLTGSPEVKAALDRTIPYTPLSTEPGEDGGSWQEQSTNIPYKHSYNGLRGRQAALFKAYRYGDGYNYFLGRFYETKFNAEWALMYAIHYLPGREAVTPPNDFIVFDRAIQGPRGRFGDWAFVATGRNPQTPGPEHDSGLAGAMCGKVTFVGALTLGPEVRNGGLNAALDAVTPRVKHAAGEDTDWNRGNVHRFLTQDEHSTAVVRERFATLATRYRLSERRSASATEDWGPGVPWIGKQVWLLTPERVVGLVQLTADASQEVFGLDTRVVLTSGRNKVSGERRELERLPDDTFAFGDLRVRFHGRSFGGPITDERFAIMGPKADDDFSVALKLHDATDPAADTATGYAPGATRWAVMETLRDGAPWALSAENAAADDDRFAVLKVVEDGRRFALVHNLTDAEQVYEHQIGPVLGTLSVHTADGTRAAADGLVRITLPAGGQAVLVQSEDPADHAATTLFYEDVFVDTVAQGVKEPQP